MGLVRTIGRWGLTALIVNGIIGSGIFGVPSELVRMLGRASPLAMILGGVGIGIIVACFAEVSSQFDEPGGVYLFTRTAFGSFAGLQAGWFWWLSAVAGVAANANLFVVYLAGFKPSLSQGGSRLLVITCMMAIPAIANYAGVRNGLTLASLLTIAKLIPLLLLIGLGIWHFGGHPAPIHFDEIKAPGWKTWIDASFILVFAYSGFEDSMAAAGEVKNPRLTLPFALIFGIGSCIAVYTLIQFVVVATTGTDSSDGILAKVASTLVGRSGAVLIAITVMISTYGYISGTILNGSRFPYSLACKGEFPRVFGILHPRFNTPFLSILVFTLLAWILAVTGTFRWTLAVTAGSAIVYFGLVSLAVIRLRRIQPHAAAFRLPFGCFFSIAGTLIALILLTRLQLREILLMGVTAMVALINWYWALNRRRIRQLPINNGTGIQVQSAGN